MSIRIDEARRLSGLECPERDKLGWLALRRMLRQPGGATSVVNRPRSGTFEPVRCRRHFALTCGNERQRTPADLHQPLCGLQGWAPPVRSESCTPANSETGVSPS